MQLLDRISLNQSSNHIELFEGDLSALPAEHSVDVLVLSAFPDGYYPTPTSLIGALDRQGLAVRDLAQDKEIDLRANFACWLSRPITGQPQLNFRRLMCFEPTSRESAPELVSGVFQSLAPFCFGAPFVRSIAMPVLAAGDQQIPLATMLPPMLDAAVHWLMHGFPLERIKIVLRSGSELEPAKTIFDAAKQKAVYLERAATHARRVQHDVFISYSRQDKECANAAQSVLQENGLNVFLDRSELHVGSVWQQKIFDAMESCRSAIMLLSPDYLVSSVCKEEFSLAWTRQREDERFMFPILVRDTVLPPHMKVVTHADCTPSNLNKVRDAVSALSERLREGR